MTFVRGVEHVFHEVVFQHTAYPHAGHEHQDISGRERCRVQSGLGYGRYQVLVSSIGGNGLTLAIRN